MRPLIPLLLLLGLGCGRGPGPQAPVPQSMNESLERFLAAVKAKDLNRMGALWGNDRGPAAGRMKPDELRMKLTVIQIYLNHTGYRVIEGPLPVPARDDLRTYRVELQRPTGCNHVVQIDVIRTGGGGWLVLDPHLESAGNPAAKCQPGAAGTRP